MAHDLIDNNHLKALSFAILDGDLYLLADRAVIYRLWRSHSDQQAAGQEKSYVGQSIDVTRRMKEHGQWNGNVETYIKKAIKHHKTESFSAEVIAWCCPLLANALEVACIARWRSAEPERGYNCTNGGVGCVMPHKLDLLAAVALPSPSLPAGVQQPGSVSLREVAVHLAAGWHPDEIAQWFNLTRENVTDIAYGRRHGKRLELTDGEVLLAGLGWGLRHASNSNTPLSLERRRQLPAATQDLEEGTTHTIQSRRRVSSPHDDAAAPALPDTAAAVDSTDQAVAAPALLGGAASLQPLDEAPLDILRDMLHSERATPPDIQGMLHATKYSLNVFCLQTALSDAWSAMPQQRRHDCVAKLLQCHVTPVTMARVAAATACGQAIVPDKIVLELPWICALARSSKLRSPAVMALLWRHVHLQAAFQRLRCIVCDECTFSDATSFLDHMATHLPAVHRAPALQWHPLSRETVPAGPVDEEAAQQAVEQ